MSTATKKVFRAEQFTSSKWDTAEQKAKFANQFVKFVESNFSYDNFPKWFYERLSLSFGHIAHYNQMGFYDTFFTTMNGKVDFILITLNHACYGDAEWTYSDVEKALQQWLKDNHRLEKLRDVAYTENYNNMKHNVITSLEQLTPEDRKELLERYRD